MITKIDMQVSQEEINDAEVFLRSQKTTANNIKNNSAKNATQCINESIKAYRARRDHRAIISLLNSTYHLNIMLGTDLLRLKSGQAVTSLL